MSTVLATLADEKSTIRWKENYVSDGLNRKLLASVPCGVVRGGHLSVSVSVLTVEIAPDSETGDSVYVARTTTGRQLTVRETGTISLSLNTGGIPGTVVYIGLVADYAVGATTVTTWGAYSEAEIDADDTIVVIGKVDVPASGVIPASDITPDRRRSAWLDRASETRDGIQLVKSGSVDVPAPGATGVLPFWNFYLVGSMAVIHSSVDKRSKQHSFAFYGDGGFMAMMQHTGDAITAPLYPIAAGQSVRFALYSKTLAINTSFQVLFTVNYYDTPGSAAGVGDRISPVRSGTDADWVRFEGEFVSPIDGWFDFVISILITPPGNTGIVFVDDIRVWLGAEDPDIDAGQSKLMGINRQVAGSMFSLLPAIPQDNLEDWAESSVHLVNITPSDSSPKRIRMTTRLDQAWGYPSAFDFILEADLGVTGHVTIQGGNLGITSGIATISGSSVNAVLDVTNIGSGHAIRGRADDDGNYGIRGDGGEYGIYGRSDGTSQTVPVTGVYGYALDPPSGEMAVGVKGYGAGGLAAYEAGIGILGFCSGDNTSVGVLGCGWSSIPFSLSLPQRYIGGLFFGRNASNPFVSPVEADRSGVVGVGGEGGTGVEPGYGGVFWGGGNGNVATRAGIYAQGGDSGDSSIDGGPGGIFYGGDSDGTPGYEGYGIYARSGNNTVSGTGARLVGRDNDGHGASIENLDSEYNVEAIKVNSGIRFAARSGHHSAQNPDYDHEATINTLKAANVPKAWGVVYCGLSGPELRIGFNVDEGSFGYRSSGGGSYLQVELAHNSEYDYDGDEFVVIANSSSGFINADVSSSYDCIEFAVFEHDGTFVDLDASNYVISFVVFAHLPLEGFDDNEPDVPSL